MRDYNSTYKSKFNAGSGDISKIEKIKLNRGDYLNEKNLIICDREITYANALAENIAEREELNVKVYTFASLQKAFLFSQGKTVHILIVDEDMEGQDKIWG